MDLRRLTHVRVNGIRELFGRRDDWHFYLQNRLELRQHRLHRRVRAQHDDVGLHLLQPGRVRFDAHADAAAQPGHLAEIAPCFRRIAVDAADDLEARTLRDLLGDGRSDRTETEVHDADAWHSDEL